MNIAGLSFMHHPVRPQVNIHAPPFLSLYFPYSRGVFLTFIHAPPREEKCTTKDAPLVRWLP